ncbi:uncharacterized protein [Choristoneura fumiferana]|uniref:uncharacterized protein n=1 Tax=Choristoneura fumiferana TaxID=7141 RepID=UPI003D158642
METEAFNTELFIDEIEKRPAIWDMTSSNYSDRNLKRRAWEELVLIFCEGDDSEEKKKLLSSSLQKKWKSLRDNYMREVKKMKTVKSGSGASKTSSYIHFNRLQFLQPSIADKHTENSFNTENESASSEVAEVEGSSAFKSPKSTPRKKQKISPADERFASILEQSLVQKNVSHPKEDDDEDKLFCLSLVKEIKKIPEYKRLHTKIGIYNLILQNQNVFQGMQHQTFENQNYRNLYHHEEIICHKSSVIKTFNIMILDHSNLVCQIT